MIVGGYLSAELEKAGSPVSVADRNILIADIAVVGIELELVQ